MTKDDRISSYKYSVLQHARKHNNKKCVIARPDPILLLQEAK